MEYRFKYTQNNAEYAYKRADGITVALTPEHVDVAFGAAEGRKEQYDCVRIIATHPSGVYLSAYTDDTTADALDLAIERTVKALCARAMVSQRTHEQLSAYVAQKGQ